MIIKRADDRQPHIAELEALLGRPDVDVHQRKSIEAEIRAIRAGVAGERQAAYEIDFHYRDHDNSMVIHDLRIEFEGRVAQIDHLLINRVLDVWVFETKAFAEGVRINEYGEWFRYGGGRAHGMASPVEQNRRHMEVLEAVFDRGPVTLPRRIVRLKPNLEPAVLVSNNARIDRPKGAKASDVDGLNTVFKIEQLVRQIERRFEARNALGALAKLVSADTIERLAHELVAMHRPASIDWAARYGLPPLQPPAARAISPKRTGPPCDGCGVLLTPGELTYSQGHAKRFTDRVLCYRCQRLPAGAG